MSIWRPGWQASIKFFVEEPSNVFFLHIFCQTLHDRWRNRSIVFVAFYVLCPSSIFCKIYDNGRHKQKFSSHVMGIYGTTTSLVNVLSCTIIPQWLYPLPIKVDQNLSNCSKKTINTMIAIIPSAQFSCACKTWLAGAWLLYYVNSSRGSVLWA